MRTTKKKPVSEASRSGLVSKTTDNNILKVNYNDNWAKQLLETIQAEINGRRAAQHHTEAVFMVGADVVQYVEPADATSSKNVLASVLNETVTPESYAWPIFEIPVTLLFGDELVSMQARYVNELRNYFPKSITTYVRDRQGWLGPFEWSVDGGAE